MECHCIPAVEVPHTTRLYSTYLQSFSAVAEFYAHPPTVEAIQRAAAGLRYDPAQRQTVAGILRAQNRQFGADASVQASLDRFAGGAAAIVTGQQVGLFSGPSYTIYKVLTAVRVAGDLTAAGIPAVPIFWLANEDHDLAEVNHSVWPARGELERLELPPDGPAARRVGEIRLGERIGGLLERATALLEGPGSADVARALADSYQPAETYGSALGKLLARLFAGKGLILLEPLSAELHRLAEPVYRAALEQHAELGRDLQQRSRALEQAGYHAQVKIAEGHTLLFLNVDGERLPLRVRPAASGARGEEFFAGRKSFTREGVLEQLARAPEEFSANVLLRPVVQDALLTTAAYLAGPAEVAYFAQASAVYRRLPGRMPVILPRASVTLVDATARRLLHKYGLEFKDVLQGRQHLRSKMERDVLPKELAEEFRAGQEVIRAALERLREPIGKLDPTLIGSLDNAQAKIEYQLSNLEGKAGRATAMRSSVLDGHERELTNLLFPNGGLQERSLCLLPMLARQGLSLLDELARCIKPGGAQHNVLYL